MPGVKQQSKYAAKRASGKMMYGPDCCAHKISPAQVEKAKENARKNGIARRESAFVRFDDEEYLV